LPSSSKPTLPGAPVFYAVPAEAAAAPRREVLGLVAPYRRCSRVELFRGPGWVDDLGNACLVGVASDSVVVKLIRTQRLMGLLAWRWNDSPSCPVSLTVMTKADKRVVQVRWIAESAHPVITAIRRNREFLVNIAAVDGTDTGWYRASLGNGNVDTPALPAADPLEHLFTFPVPGIPGTRVGEPVDPWNVGGSEYPSETQYPSWPEPVADFWSLMHSAGPWKDELEAHDRGRAEWGFTYARIRASAARGILALRDRFALAGEAPYFDERGMVVRFPDAPSDLGERSARLVERWPLVGECFAAVAGPRPDPRGAADTMYRIVTDPKTMSAFVSGGNDVLGDMPDEVLHSAMTDTVHLALLDHRITQCGARRPWLENDPSGGLMLGSNPVNLDAPLALLSRMWRTGFGWGEVLEARHRLGPDDLPCDREEVCQAFASLQLEGSLEAAWRTVDTLLREAQQARQWSIPFGARVEIELGPFVALRIFEDDVDIACHFLDRNDRYLVVIVGLTHNPPRLIPPSVPLPARHPDTLEFWNDAAQVTIALVAAAIVRDFLVVEDRESLFSARPFRRRLGRVNHRTVIYLPRVRYSRAHPGNPPPDDIVPVRGRHHVAPHLRRAGTASPEQLFLALRYNVRVPQGFTFVRPHERGSAADAERIRIYRSRSASRMLFEVVERAPSGDRPRWFQFERDCAGLMRMRGWTVIHQAASRDGDGGVDLYATDVSGAPYVVQCKCWAADRPVGPDVVRELAGAIQLVGAGSAVTPKGVLVTSSTFTSGAVEAAIALGFELVDGARFANLLAPSQGSAPAAQP
jgi:hypothetical protein